MFSLHFDPIDQIFQRLMPTMEKVGLKPFAIFTIPNGNLLNDYSLRICYIDEKRAGRLPVREECRDDLDFEYKIDSWLTMAKVYSPKYPTWEALIDGEKKRLENV